MKSFRTKMSVTKLVLLEMVTTLIAIEIWKTYNGLELDQVFIDAFLMVIAFYFGQKGMQYTEVDSVIKEEPLDESKE